MAKTILLCRVGNDARPACEEDIKDLKKCLADALKDPNGILVTHHAVELLVITLPESFETEVTS